MFGILDEIARAVLAVHDVGIPMDHLLRHLHPLFPHCLHLCERSMQLPDFSLVFFLGERLIEKVILLLAEIGTEATIAASAQI